MKVHCDAFLRDKLTIDSWLSIHNLGKERNYDPNDPMCRANACNRMDTSWPETGVIFDQGRVLNYWFR